MKPVIKNEQLHEKQEKKIKRESFLDNETYTNINKIRQEKELLWSEIFTFITNFQFHAIFPCKTFFLIIYLIHSSIRNVHDKSVINKH